MFSQNKRTLVSGITVKMSPKNISETLIEIQIITCF